MNKSPIELYDEINSLKINKYKITYDLEINHSNRVELYFKIKHHSRAIALEDLYITHNKRKSEFALLCNTINELEEMKKIETTLKFKANKIENTIESKLIVYNNIIKPYKDTINKLKEKFHEELDVIFNAKCLICYEIGISAKLNIPCCLPNTTGTIHCSGSFCVSCCKKLFSTFDPEVKCPVCRSIYTKQLSNINFYMLDQDKIRLIDQYIDNFWKKNTKDIENINEIPKNELRAINCDKCDTGFDSLFEMYRHQTGRSSNICSHALVPCKVCKFLFCKKDIINNYCDSCLYN